MHYLKLAFMIGVLFVIQGCSGVQISQDYPPDTEYSILKTYAWQSPDQQQTGDLRLDNPLLDKRIRKAIDGYLLDLGYQRVTSVNPDFFVAYKQQINNKTYQNNTGSGFVFGLGSFNRYGGIGFSSGTQVSSYEINLLVITIIDSAGANVIWRGIGTRTFEQHTDPEKMTQRVDETVNKILAQFPPHEK